MHFTNLVVITSVMGYSDTIGTRVRCTLGHSIVWCLLEECRRKEERERKVGVGRPQQLENGLGIVFVYWNIPKRF